MIKNYDVKKYGNFLFVKEKIWGEEGSDREGKMKSKYLHEAIYIDKNRSYLTNLSQFLENISICAGPFLFDEWWPEMEGCLLPMITIRKSKFEVLLFVLEILFIDIRSNLCINIISM